MYEAHLTVEAETVERRQAFAAVCEALGVKCVLIELARGAHRSQPMTSSHHSGALADVQAEVAALQARLVDAGFTVLRVKIESELTDEVAGLYFEFHAKVLAGEDVEALRALCVANGAHLSNNAIERGVRFVTLRVYEASRDEACARFEHLLAVLGDYEILGTKAEVTIHDSRVELDAGWLP